MINYNTKLIHMMTQRAYISRIRIAGFGYKGLTFPEVEVAPDIEDLASHRPAYALHANSTTLAEVAIIYELALTARFGNGRMGVSEEVVKAALSIYENIHSRVPAGVWTDDACDYHNIKRPKGILVPEDYIPVRWVKHPVFKQGSAGWEASMCEGSEELHTFVPPEGFVIPTIDGFYHPDTGTPFATERDEDRAKRLLDRVGLDAEKEASYFWRRELYEGGIGAVSHRNYRRDYGPFMIHVGAEPDFVDDCIGSRPIRRSESQTGQHRAKIEGDEPPS